nr:hypothetical protein [Tanacetum cinerariifolium]
MSKTREDYGSGVTRPTINQDTPFELKGQFLKELRDNTFSGSEQEDANEHIDKKRLSSDSCWKLLISSIFFAVRSGGHYLFRNLVLRTSQVVIEPDGWFHSHLFAAPNPGPDALYCPPAISWMAIFVSAAVLVGMAPLEPRICLLQLRTWEKREALLDLESVCRIDYTEYVVLLEEQIRCLDCKSQYVVLSGKVDTRITGGYGVSVDLSE